MALDINDAQVASCFELVRGKYLKVRDDILFILPTMTAVPTADDDVYGALYLTAGGAGVADTLSLIGKNSSDADATAAVPTSIAASGQRQPVVSGEANLALTAALSGSLILMDDATQAFTLPAITAADVGIWFELFSTVAATATTITAQSGDLLIGAARISSTTAGGDDSFQPDVSDDLILTMNGTTQGGMVGSSVVLTAISATRWRVKYEGVGSGTLVTPFS